MSSWTAWVAVAVTANKGASHRLLSSQMSLYSGLNSSPLDMKNMNRNYIKNIANFLKSNDLSTTPPLFHGLHNLRITIYNIKAISLY